MNVVARTPRAARRRPVPQDAGTKTVPSSSIEVATVGHVLGDDVFVHVWRRRGSLRVSRALYDEGMVEEPYSLDDEAGEEEPRACDEGVTDAEPLEGAVIAVRLEMVRHYLTITQVMSFDVGSQLAMEEEGALHPNEKPGTPRPSE